MREINYAVNCIRRELTKVESDPFTPAVLSPEMTEYLIDLTVRNASDRSEFSRFVISLPRDAIRNELLRRVIPENLQRRILDLRAEHEALQIKKEHDVGEHDFDSARQCRDQQEGIIRTIHELIADQSLVISPDLVDSVLKSLGYNGP